MSAGNIKRAYKPEDLDRLFVEGITSGDIETVLGLYEENAVLLSFVDDEPHITTQEERRKRYEGLIASHPKFKIIDIVTVMHGDGVLATTRMKVESEVTGPDGKKSTSLLHTLEVCRKQADGTWKFAIDDPRGSSR